MPQEFKAKGSSGTTPAVGRFKSAAELDRQFTAARIDAYSHNRYREFPKQESLIEGNTPSEAVALLRQAGRDWFGQGGHYELSRDYRVYLEALRKLYRERLDSDAGMKGEAAACAGIDSPGPATLRRLLSHMDLSRISDEPEKLIEGVKNREQFLAVVEAAIAERPETIMPLLPVCEHLLAREQIQETLRAMLASSHGLAPYYLENIVGFFEPDEARGIVRNISESSPRPLFEKFALPELQTLFGAEEARVILNGILEKVGGEIALSEALLRKYVELEFLTAEDIRAHVHREIGRTTYALSLIRGAGVYFPEESPERDRLRTEIKAAFLREEKPLAVIQVDYSLTDTIDGKPFLNEIERADIVRACLARNPQDLWRSPEVLVANLPRGEYRDLILGMISSGSFVEFSSSFAGHVIASAVLDENEKRMFIDQALLLRRADLLKVTEEVFKLLPEVRHQEAAEILIELASSRQAYEKLPCLFSIIGASPARQKEILAEVISGDESLKFLALFLKEEDQPNLIQQNFSRDEIESAFVFHTEVSTQWINDQLEAVERFLGGKEAVVKMIMRAAESSPADMPYKLWKLEKYLPTKDLRSLVDCLAEDVRGYPGLIMNLRHISSGLGERRAVELVSNVPPGLEAEVLSDLPMWKDILPAGESERHVVSLIDRNPLAGLFALGQIREVLPDLSLAEILDRARLHENFEYAPKSLNELFRKLGKADPGTISQSPLLFEAVNYYFAIGAIENAGFRPEVFGLLNTQEIRQRDELRLLEIFACFARLKEVHPECFSQMHSYGASLEEAEAILLAQMTTTICPGREVTADEIARFINTMGTPAPFLTYYLQHEKSPQHRNLMRDMYESILSGNYHDWRFLNGSPEAFDQLKEQKLLPARLTLEQYHTWQQDSRTELHATMATDAQRTVKELRKLLLQNMSHLGEAFREDHPAPVSLEEAQTLISQTGKQIGVLAKRISAIERGEVVGIEGEQERLAAQRTELERDLELHAFQRTVFRLLELTPREISGGYLLHKSDPNKKVAKLSQVLEEFKAGVPPDGAFLYPRVTGILDSFYNQNSEPQALTASDVSDPKVSIEIGAKPVGSCQHFGHGSLNEALLGYTDPNTKILVLRNELGALVARAVLRLVSKPDGQPALHLERTYSSSTSAAVQRSLILHARSKADEMGMALYSTLEVDQAQVIGEQSELETPIGYIWRDSEVSLTSSGARAPIVYVDSAGGSRSRGRFTLTGLVELIPQGR